ncbi:MAG: ester cyclase [Chloroflexales bacterium]|nr:ester cyclase [Chloroflexales bacterium]
MTPDAHTPQATTAPADLVQQFVAAVWNRADPAAADRLLHPAYIDHAYQPANRAGLEATLAQLSSSFPDHAHTIEATVAQGDLVVLRMRLRATHQGAFRGTPPTGSPVDVTVYRMFRVADGRIAEHWGLLDTTALLRQIGATPGS